MVYSEVLVIRGIVLSREEVCLEKGIPTDIDDDTFMEEYFYPGVPFLGNFELHTWPCCSKINGGKFILGYVISRYNIQKIFDNCVPYAF